jgi:hypothetical protein
MEKLAKGLVGIRERFVTKSYITDECLNLGMETKLYIEETHSGRIEGQYFDDVEELLPEELSLESFKTLDEYVQWKISLGFLDEYISENNIIEESLSYDEQKEVILQLVSPEIIDSFLALKDNEELYICDGYNGEIYDYNKNNLVLTSISDGKFQKIYENTSEIIEDIDNDFDDVSVYIYNQMSTKKREKYLDEYSKIDALDNLVEKYDKVQSIENDDFISEEKKIKLDRSR